MASFARHGLWPVWKWFSNRDNIWHSRWKPRCWIAESVTIVWLTTEADSQSSLCSYVDRCHIWSYWTSRCKPWRHMHTLTILDGLKHCSLGMCGMDFLSSVRFWKKNGRFGFLYRSVLKYKKNGSCLSCVFILHFGQRLQRGRIAQLLSQPVLYSINCIITLCRLIIWFHGHLLSDSVRNVKNVKALWEWLKYWLFVWDKFGFEKSHGNWNFGFDLLALVRFGFLKTEPKFGFCTSLLFIILLVFGAVKQSY